MTENEVIKELLYQEDMRGKGIRYQVNNLVIATAVKALREIQQYRKIGTVERFQQLSEQFKPHVTDKTSCPERHCNKCDKYRKEAERYRAIGTVEECREARERQRVKKPILCMNEQSGMFVDYADGHGEYKTQMNNWWRCSCCNEVVGQRVIVHKHIHDQRKKNYCEKCGQALDWSD